MTPRPDVSDERRTQIIEAALAVFARDGFARSRMDDIAEEAGLSKGALYWYFKGKDAIIIALLEHIFAHYKEEMRNLHGAEGTATERLLYLVELATAEVKRIPNAAVPLLYEFYALAMRRKVIREQVRDYFREFIQIVADIVRQGIDRGEFRDVDPEKPAIQLGAMYEGLGLLWVFDPENISWDELSDSAAALILDGLKADR